MSISISLMLLFRPAAFRSLSYTGQLASMSSTVIGATHVIHILANYPVYDKVFKFSIRKEMIFISDVSRLDDFLRLDVGITLLRFPVRTS